MLPSAPKVAIPMAACLPTGTSGPSSVGGGTFPCAINNYTFYFTCYNAILNI